MTSNGLDKSKEKIIKEFFEKKDNKDFKGFKIQAGPGTGKTYLLKKVISRLVDEGNIKNICILSFSNSSIDTIGNELKEKNNIEIKTIASFFIENFIIPFSYSILINENINNPFEKELLKRISNNFSENDLQNNEWKILNGLIEKYGNIPKYFELFHILLTQKGIKYIFIDEYQDTKKHGLEIFNKIIKIGKIKFFCVGDKNQQIDFDNLHKNCFIGLDESHNLKTTYRFQQNILDKINKDILNSGIEDFNKEKTKPGYINNLKCKIDFDNLKSSNKYVYRIEYEKIINFIINYIEVNRQKFIGKSNVILFQPTTDEKKNGLHFGDRFNNKLEELLKDNTNIIFSYTEKPIYNIHLKLFFEKLISFVNGEILYSEIEKELNFFYDKGKNNNIFKNIFLEILKIKPKDNFENIINLLNYGFKNGGDYKKYFEDICKILISLNINFEEGKGKELIKLVNKKEENKIYISTNTITSSKGKEYDNLFILDIYNWNNFKYTIDKTNGIGETKNSEIAKRHYYVAISRAKENVFTFVDY